MMATPKSQRIAIWVIAVVLGVGTIGTYFVAILANQNNEKDQARQNATLQEYKANNIALDGHSAAPFDKSSVTELKSEDLVVGTGATATADTSVTLDYFGWTSDGVIFDSTKKKDNTGQPYTFKPSKGEVIAGWVQGIPGMKVGGVRKLTIPADLAYGATGSAPLIAANEPLQFIVKLNKVE